MRTGYWILLTFGVVIAGCAGPQSEIATALPSGAEATPVPPVTTRPGEPPPGVPIRVGKHDILYLTGVTAYLPRKAVPYLIARQPLSTTTAAGEPGDDVISSHALKPTQTGAPPLTCRIVSREGGRRVSVVIESRSRLPALNLTAILPADVYPARWQGLHEPQVCQLAIGPATRLVFDSLRHATDGACVSLAGDVSFAAQGSGYWLKARADPAGTGQSTLLRLELRQAEKNQTAATKPAPPLPRLASPVSLAHARRCAAEWAFSPVDEVPAIPSPAEALQHLPAERASLLSCIYPQQPVRRVDRSSDSDVRNLAIARPPLQWNMLYLNNPSAADQTKTLSLKAMGIIPPTGSRLAVYDYWQEQLLAITDDTLEVDLPADDCRVLCVRDVRPNQPAAISTGRHITQGFPDLSEIRYDAVSMSLSGNSVVTGDEPYELRILLPTAGQNLEISGIEAAGVSWLVRANGPLRIVSFESETAQTVEWRIRFRKTIPTLTVPLPPERMVTHQNTRGVLLTWDTGEARPVRYRVYRDGKPFATVAGSENRYQDSDVVYNLQYVYTIRSVDRAGRESKALPPAAHRTPIPADAYLTQLVPLSIEYTACPPTTNRSIGGKTLRMAGRRYNRGLGTTTGTKVEYFLGKGYERFSGEVGIDDETETKGQARFKIRGDGRELFRSEPLGAGQKPQQFDVSVQGCRRLTLSVMNADGGDGKIHADWGDTYLHASPTPGR